MLDKGLNRNIQKTQKKSLGRFSSELKKNKSLFLMLLPTVILVFVMCYIPMAGVILAFKNFKFNLGIWKSPCDCVIIRQELNNPVIARV